MIASTRAHGLSSWMPEALDVDTPAASLVDLQAILDIFRVAAGQIETSADESAPAGEASRAQSRLEAWVPADLNEMEFIEVANPSLLYESPLEVYEAPHEMTPNRAPAPGESAAEEARAILEQAQEQAEEILLNAQRSADELIAEARQEITATQEAAYRQGIEEAQNEARSYLAAAKTILSEIDTWKDQLFEQSTPLIIEMVKDIAQKMFGQGVALDDQAMQQNLNRVLNNAKSLGDLNIYLNPLDAATLNTAWRDMCASVTGSQIRIFPAEAITRGGCYVQGQWGAIDARVETQIQTVLDAFDTVSAAEVSER